MLVCRTLPNSPLHVHDEPSHYADIARNDENGWVQRTECQRPDESHTKGDTANRFNTVIDLVSRPLGILDHNERARFYGGR